MNDESLRPDPDALLALAGDVESQRGKLTIFFGAAPGVGKTYAMLEEAQNQKKENVDIVVGYVEPHKRKDTEGLLSGLEAVPTLKSEYKKIVLSEVDVDAVLRRHPKIVLVDELAHTNAPGARHEKRYQDVEEILQAGIDVHTTLNVQHLESLNDAVLGVTGIPVKETVPDSVFFGADEVKIIDLSPRALLKRLAEGKVYLGEMAERAVERFFTVGNLTALRELALRAIATRVDKDMDVYRKLKASKEPWPVADKILVCLFSSPSAEHLVRCAFRLASELNARWVALHVVTERDNTMTDQEKAWLLKAVGLAKELGAEMVSLRGVDAADVIIRFAQDHNIAKIILGKPNRLGKGLFFSWKMIMGTPGIDIFWFSHEFKKGILFEKRRHNPWGGVFYGLLCVGAAALLGQILRNHLNETNTLFFMLLPVVAVSIRFNRRSAVISSALSVALFDYLFVKPYYTFAIMDIQYFLSFVVFALIAFGLSSLAAQLRFQIRELRRSEAKSAALYNLTSDLLAAKTMDQVAEVMLNNIRRILPCDAGVFLFGEGQQIVIQKRSPGFVFDEKEEAVALWVQKNAQPAGPGTKTLREARAIYLPVKRDQGVEGVIGIKLSAGSVLTADQQALLSAVGRVGVLALKQV
ncbi:MAG: sensor histidine kinase KdpD [Candidatus Omnitrophica bacterium]|nr:sensor histidine kinase KdpD [Candidatus Omnitrophota bacterium]